MISIANTVQRQFDNMLNSLREHSKRFNLPIEHYLLQVVVLSEQEMLAHGQMKPHERETYLIDKLRPDFHEMVNRQKSDRHRLGGLKTGEKSQIKRDKRYILILQKELELRRLGFTRISNKRIANELHLAIDYVRKARTTWKPKKAARS